MRRIVLMLVLLTISPLTLLAIDFEANTYEGGTFSLSELRGKVVVIVVAQTTCPHCKEFLPALSRAWRSDSELLSGKYVVAVVMLDPAHPLSNTGRVEDKRAFEGASPPEGWILLPEAWHAIEAFGIKYTASVVIVDQRGDLVEVVDPRRHPKVDEMVSYTITKVKEVGSRIPVLKLKLQAPRVAVIGDAVTLTGEVQPPSVGVDISLTKPNGEELVLRPRVVGNGEFSLSFTPDSEGTWIVRASADSEVREARIMVIPNKPRGIENYDVLYGRNDERAGRVISQKARKAESLPKDNVVLLGGPKANNLVIEFNSIAGVSMFLRGSEARLFVKSKEYNLTVKFGREDYAVVYWLRWEGRFVVVGEGFTRFGTLAASMFIRTNQLEDQLYLIHWIDSNGNGDVELSEIEVIMRLDRI
ncbi:MAG: TlpA disulfide reductase family protein [Candidatus Korarchaeum sp.]